ncbi:MAG: helix-turn-helix domain-containing protein [Clostridia bacterium]
MVISSNDVKKILGKKIRSYRKRAGCTQEDVAENIGISIDLLRSIENGRNIGSMTTLLNICNFLKVSPNSLFYELLDFKEETVDSFLFTNIQKLSKKDKKILKEILLHLDRNY